MNFNEFKNIYRTLNTEEKRKEFIDERLNQLLSETSEQKIGLGQCDSYNGFITPLNELVSNNTAFLSNMCFDDFTIYEDFMNYIYNDVDNYIPVEPALIACVQQYIYKYFGYNSGGVLERIELYNSADPVSIKDLKGKDIAACSERSALAQNLLKFCGCDSEIMFGKFKNKDPHAYLIIQPIDKDFKLIYDPMNPVTYIDSDGLNRFGTVGISKVTNEEYTSLKNGGTYTFDYSIPIRLFGRQNINYTQNERTYTCDDFLNKQKEK